MKRLDVVQAWGDELITQEKYDEAIQVYMLLWESDRDDLYDSMVDAGNYMLYFGDYVVGSRNGQGHWIGYYDGNNYHAEGSWTDDKPSDKDDPDNDDANLDGFVQVSVNNAIEQLEGNIMEIKMYVGGKLVPVIMKALTSTKKATLTSGAIALPLDTDPDTDPDPATDTDVVPVGPDYSVFNMFNSIAGLNFTKALLQEALKVGKVTLQVVLDAFDAELAVIDEQIALQTKVAETYKAIMNAWLGIVPNDESETAPLDGEGEGDDEE